MELLTKWTPPAGMTVQPWLSSLDGSGGFAVVETDNPADLVTVGSAFGPFFDFQIHPVIDFAEAMPAVQKGIRLQEVNPLNRDTLKGSLLVGSPLHCPGGNGSSESPSHKTRLTHDESHFR